MSSITTSNFRRFFANHPYASACTTSMPKASNSMCSRAKSTISASMSTATNSQSGNKCRNTRNAVPPANPNINTERGGCATPIKADAAIMSHAKPVKNRSR